MRTGVLRIVSLPLTALASIIAARVLGVDQYGVYAFALSFVSLIGMPVQLGLPTIVVRETAAARACNNHALVWQVATWAGRYILQISLCLSVIVYLCLFFLPPLAGTERATTLMWAFPLVLLLALANLRSSVLLGFNRIIPSMIPESIVRPTLLIGLFLLLGYWQMGRAPYAIAANLGATLVAFISGGILLSIYGPKSPNLAQADAESVKRWRDSIIPLSLVGGLQLVSYNTDILMLGLMRSDAEAGLYKVAVSTATLALVGLQVTNIVVKPWISRLYAEKNNAELQKLAAWSAVVAFLTTLPVLVITFFFGRPILIALYGEHYSAATAPLILLLAAQTANAFFGSVGNLLTQTGHERENLRGLIVSTLLNVVLNALLIPWFGIVGAAAATGISIVAWNILFWRSVHRRLNIESTPLYFLRRKWRN